MSIQTVGFESSKKGFDFYDYYNKRFLNYNDFVLSINSDAELINKLGFSHRIKKGGVKSRTENDYLSCYKHYLDIEIRKYGDNFICFNYLNKAYKILIYLINQKNSFEQNKNKMFFDEKQSIILAKLKSVIRSTIIEYNIYKLNNYSMAVAWEYYCLCNPHNLCGFFNIDFIGILWYF